MTSEEARTRLAALGLSPAAVDVLLAHFEDADRRGKSGHGLSRVEWLGTLDFDPDARPLLLESEEGFERWDGHAALGYLVLEEVVRATLDAFPAQVPAFLLARPERFALLHGDFRLDNVMLGPGSLTVVDWQTLTVGLPARDLAYWVATSCEPEQRRGVEAAAVSAYHEALGVPGYDLAACEEDYRTGQLHTLLIVTLGWAFTTQTERGGDMMLAMARRSCAAIRDLGVL